MTEYETVRGLPSKDVLILISCQKSISFWNLEDVWKLGCIQEICSLYRIIASHQEYLEFLLKKNDTDMDTYKNNEGRMGMYYGSISQILTVNY